MRIILAFFAFSISRDALARSAVFNTTFSGFMIAVAVVLALYLWRKNPLISLSIVSAICAYLLSATEPLLVILICFAYLFYKSRNISTHEKYESKQQDIKIIATEDELENGKIQKDVLVDDEVVQANVWRRWTRLSEYEFIDELNPTVVLDENNITVVVQQKGTGILYKSADSDGEKFIPEMAIKDFWKY